MAEDVKEISRELQQAIDSAYTKIYLKEKMNKYMGYPSSDSKMEKIINDIIKNEVDKVSV